MHAVTIAAIVALGISAIHAILAAWCIDRLGKSLAAQNDRILALERARTFDAKTRVWRKGHGPELG